jgi:hypothetical protein
MSVWAVLRVAQELGPGAGLLTPAGQTVGLSRSVLSVGV